MKSDFDFVFHLSHIDLDGYGCQFLTTQVFKEIACYNANYGAEVGQRLEQIIEDIQASSAKTPLILITDLNLSTKEARALEKSAMSVGAKIVLLDHHATGKSAAERFAWYYLDTTRSATLITYEWLQEHFSFDKEGSLRPMIEAINAIDIWVDESNYFDYGRVLLGMISGAREINRVVFANEDRAYKLWLIQSANKILQESTLEDAPIILDEKLHFIKKDFFKEGKNDTKDNLVADYVTQILTQNKDLMQIHFGGKVGILTYNTGNTSLIGNNFLVKNSDFDFYMDINSRGGFSLRSNNKMDVSKMAEIIGNGGGHPNASGGRLEGYKDNFVYSKIKESVQHYLDTKEEA